VCASSPERGVDIDRERRYLRGWENWCMNELLLGKKCNIYEILLIIVKRTMLMNENAL